MFEPTEDVRLIKLAQIDEGRGQLLSLGATDLPFFPKRLFIVRNVPAESLRGGHAHKENEQLLICLRGAVTVRFVAAGQRGEVRLANTTHGPHLRAGVWAEQFYETGDSELLVLASMPYDPDSYILQTHAME